MTLFIQPFTLLKCPFCGSDATLKVETNLFYAQEYMVRCNECCADVDYFKNAHDAIESWNKRPQSKP